MLQQLQRIRRRNLRTTIIACFAARLVMRPSINPRISPTGDGLVSECRWKRLRWKSDLPRSAVASIAAALPFRRLIRQYGNLRPTEQLPAANKVSGSTKYCPTTSEGVHHRTEFDQHTNRSPNRLRRQEDAVAMLQGFGRQLSYWECACIRYFLRPAGAFGGVPDSPTTRRRARGAQLERHRAHATVELTRDWTELPRTSKNPTTESTVTVAKANLHPALRSAIRS